MALYSFITKQCNADLRKHSLLDAVTAYAAKIEYDQSPGSVDLYPSPFLKRNVRRHYRLIIEERRLGEDIVYCFLRVFQRSDSEYAQYMKLSNQGQLHLFSKKYAPVQEELQAYLGERKSQHRVEPLPVLSPAEHTYLLGLTNTTDGAEQSIIESHSWVERISINAKPGFRLEYFNLLQKLLWEGDIDPAQTVIGQGKYWMLYRYFPKSDKLFLVAPLEPKVREKDEHELRQKYSRLFTANDQLADQIIKQEGLRSYPSIVTADQELWLDIQDSKEANLSLSPEEMDVLNSVLRPSTSQADTPGQEAMYPLFINGRPGSGKSTILLYLFAEHLHFHLQQIWSHKTTGSTGVLENAPIYLTYSDSLLKDARRIVQDILRCDSDKAQSQYDLNDVEIKQTINNSFGNFREFLKSALPVTYRQHFDPQYFVDFPHFKHVFIERTAHEANTKLRDLSPELAWHVIRTFIKGMRQETEAYLDTEAYEHELPRKQQTVTNSTFDLVYTEVWEKFYKPYCVTEGYWDDQDLARKLLDLSEKGTIELSLFPAVFCDESQDFTKIELELVFQLSRFSKRSIKLNELHSLLPRIPFAFAGDPFQTLNPTGFDWDATKAFFHNSIVRPLDPGGRADLTFNYQELEFNYRSAQPIVQFCNLIQLMRGRAFNIKGIKPQKTWQIRPALNPIYYDIAQAGCQQAMQTQQALIYIVPCQEGEEEAYVKQDPFLKRIAWNDDEQTVSLDVLSPARAKGLQFQRVVLYKFGEHALHTHHDHINLLLDPFIDRTGQGESLPKEDTLPLEYFVNHLYVAASRPRQQLIIVDTRKALDNFWAFAIEGDQQALIYSYPTHQDWNQEHIARLIPGSKESWYQIKDNALTLGHDFFAKGKELRDPYFMERARQNFSTAREHKLADQALAFKLYYEGKLKEAGHIYTKLGQLSQALACFWQAQSYDEITKLRPDFDTIRPKFQLIFYVAQYLEGEKTIDACIQCIEYIYEGLRANKDIKQTIVTDSHWGQIIQETIQQLALKIDKNEDAQVTVQDWKKVWLQVTGILEKGILLSDTISLARIACIAEEYATSKQLLIENNISPTNTTEWTSLAFAESSEYPEKIRWLSRLGLHKRIIQAYKASLEDSSQNILNNRDATLVFKAFIQEDEFDLARRFLSRYPNEKRYLALLSKLIHKEEYYPANQVVLEIIHFYILTAKWNAALHFVLALPNLPESISNKKNVGLRLDSAKVHAYFIQKLARSEALQRESSLSQRHAISKYLQMQLVNPSQSLQAHLQLLEAGAAFEKAGIFEDILDFYESIINQAQSNNSELAQWAELRWIKTKFRQASSISAESMRHKAINVANSKLREWNVPKNKIQTASKYPLLEPMKATILPVEDVPIPETENTLIATLSSSMQPIAEATEEEVIVVAGDSSSSSTIGLPAWKDIPKYTNSGNHGDGTPSETDTAPTTETQPADQSTTRERISSDIYVEEEAELTIRHVAPTSEMDSMDSEESSEDEIISVDVEEPISISVDNPVSIESGEFISEPTHELTNGESTEQLSIDTEELVSAESKTRIPFDNGEPIRIEAEQPGKQDSKEHVDTHPPQEEKQLIPTTRVVSKVSSPVRAQELTTYVPAYIQDMPIKVSLSLLVGRNQIECELIHHLRVLELRHKTTQTRIDILAEAPDVRDSYGVLTIQQENTDSLSDHSWHVIEWALRVHLQDLGTVTNIKLEHAPTGIAIIQLQL